MERRIKDVQKDGRKESKDCVDERYGEEDEERREREEILIEVYEKRGHAPDTRSSEPLYPFSVLQKSGRMRLRNPHPSSSSNQENNKREREE